MLVLLSPAKTLDFTTPWKTEHSTPDMLHHTQELAERMRTCTVEDIEQLMGVSRPIAELNWARFRDFALPLRPNAAKPAILAFKGDTYRDLPLDGYTVADYAFAQRHVRILSGFYGLLRPLDLILPYRLEMGTRLPTARGANLYEFWGDRITRRINEALSGHSEAVVVNCASDEYFGAVRRDALEARVIKPVFKDYKAGTYKVISFFAKRARGAMASFVVKGRVASVEALKAFEDGGYRFSAAESSADELVFLRRAR